MAVTLTNAASPAQIATDKVDATGLEIPLGTRRADLPAPEIVTTCVRERSGQVLLVDDEPILRKLIARRLAREGYVVYEADDGAEALNQLYSAPVDLFICDLHMPGMSGFELLKTVHEHFPKLFTIAISGLAQNELNAELSTDGFCQKNSLFFEQLLQQMSDLMRRFPIES